VGSDGCPHDTIGRPPGQVGYNPSSSAWDGGADWDAGHASNKEAPAYVLVGRGFFVVGLGMAAG